MKPNFYDRSKVGTLYLPDAASAAEYGIARQLNPAIGDTRKILLVNVDFQVDFVFGEGSLAVPGAVDDVARTVEWIYAHMGEITTIASSLDSHVPYQIFSPLWWADQDGNHPAPFTLITKSDVVAGKWVALVDPAWSLHYLDELEKGGKKQLMIWPYHTLIGSAGGILVPALSEAIMAHAAARHAQPVYLVKGQVPQTENYSIVEPEVKVASHPSGGLNKAFLDLVSRHDLVYIAGEAKSHCVLDTMHSIVNHFAGSPDILGKIRFLRDCTSSVFHPDIDFDAMADAELAKMEQLGIRLVNSTDPIS
jgi:nicotinamidase-related amidase